jgi:hypothetical protein
MSDSRLLRKTAGRRLPDPSPRDSSQARHVFGSRSCCPLNRGADEEGYHFDREAVRTPHGFHEVYRCFCEAGWPSLACYSYHADSAACVRFHRIAAPQA